MWDRFDIVEAYYLAFRHCHGGQWSPEYHRLCKMLTYFKPGPWFCEATLSENGLEIYDALCAKFLKD